MERQIFDKVMSIVELHSLGFKFHWMENLHKNVEFKKCIQVAILTTSEFESKSVDRDIFSSSDLNHDLEDFRISSKSV